MIGNLSGIVDEVRSDHIILNVNDIGYIVHLSAKTLSACAIGSRIKLLIETYANNRENTAQLYGFISKEEQQCLRLLVKVSGVSYKTAMSILSKLTPEQLFLAIMNEDKVALKMSGLGLKLINRIITELSGKVRALNIMKSISCGKEYAEDARNINIRPEQLDDFVGQKDLIQNLKVFINAAKTRTEALDHVLLYGPPGLGKTTLAQIISKELRVSFRATSGPLLSKAGDLAAVLTTLNAKDVLFIDEIHRLNRNIEEVLYTAMEDFCLDILVGEGPSTRTLRIDLPPFTLIGATTRLGLLSAPLRDRFGIPLHLEFYSFEELVNIIKRGARVLSTEIEENAAREIACRARGTPRIALRLLRRIRDFVEVKDDKKITYEVADSVLLKLGVDKMGLNKLDMNYLRFLFNTSGPVGIDTISIALSEDVGNIEETVEPYLIKISFVKRTPRGRVLTDQAKEYLSL
ncbi:holliday junction ATP-dependent DNA helicase RuvB [Trichonephila clavata]|uniref:Holliday junction ATP-dependent DNA helicase RuvB n=1 Tax=Trichonephila clavata TaxID=2740835 RepID=A0A8X6HRT6_TRICU|nr:holliday junction ATP-dependent DNA helicase RuvB [Trichonephila clavata]GFR19751.1 holliday junction ATP-dependent DNA helicase RuvB [Trichonephila clavata]